MVELDVSAGWLASLPGLLLTILHFCRLWLLVYVHRDYEFQRTWNREESRMFSWGGETAVMFTFILIFSVICVISNLKIKKKNPPY